MGHPRVYMFVLIKKKQRFSPERFFSSTIEILSFWFSQSEEFEPKVATARVAQVGGELEYLDVPGS